jgi:tRNA A-37 threonylcarbamoyl transferase component Bud32
MKQTLGNFEILEPLEYEGSAHMYRGVEHLGEGFSRPAAIKVLPNFRLDDEQLVRDLRREVEMLVEVSSCPYIVTIYGLGIEAETGAWIAMELSGRSLKRFISDRPADPDQVRVMLRDTLRGLAVVHGAEPQILHRDLKPANVFCSEYGTWQIGDFGLATRRVEDEDETLDVMTVQYAAPECLDAALGQVSPQSDLYSLGMVAYELALGRTLYRRQFPSVYDPKGDPQQAGDVRPKWMYWHTSRQMSVPPVAEIMPDFPRDLSDLIAAMMVKPIPDRLGSAAEALERLGEVAGTAAAPPSADTGEAKAGDLRRTLILAAVALVLIIALGVTALLYLTNRTEIHLDGGGLFTGSLPQIAVTGAIEDFPDEGAALIALRDGSTFPVTVDDEGRFGSLVTVGRLGEVDALLTVSNRSGKEVARRIVRIDRSVPESVQVVVRTKPPAAGARVSITDRAGAEPPILQDTDADGVARLTVPYGSFDLEVTHPRYKPLSGTADTGVDPVKSIVANLVPLAETRLAQKRTQLLSEMDRLAEAAAGGDEQAAARLQELRRQLAQIGPPPGAEGEEVAAGNANAARRQALLEELDEVAARAAAGDPEAAARLKEIRRELAELEAPQSATAAAAGPAAVGGGNPATAMSRIDQATLMRLPLVDLKAFVASNVPVGALRVETVPQISKVRVSGPLFNKVEMDLLVKRLTPAAPRLEFEVRIDPWGLCRQLERGLAGAGATDPRVYAYLAPGDETVYVQFTGDEKMDVDAVTSIAASYVLQRDLLVVQRFPPAPAPEAEPEA